MEILYSGALAIRRGRFLSKTWRVTARRTVAATRTDSITRARTDLQGTCGTGEKESNNNNNNDHGKKTGKEP